MTSPKIRDIFTTYALIYANGPVHLGHLLGFIQCDIWVRFQKYQGHRCHFISGTDTHGTPIMLNAEKLGVTPEAMIEKMGAEQRKDLQTFGVQFDQFDSTHKPHHQAMVYKIYQKLAEEGVIQTKTIEQAFDEEKQMFLPDRYLKGTCPSCNAADQYGDGCEVCGANYDTQALKNPISVLSGKPPIYKESEHYFFDLPQFETRLKTWISEGHVQPEAANKLNEWFIEGLQSWDISRDAPYFGFLIPGTQNKYFYVWLDAPIGYLSAFQHYADQIQLDTHPYLDPSSKAPTEMRHFIGKDILYFHTLFWPALLMGAKIRTPTQVHAHGYLTINGQKMSKSRGTFIRAQDYLAQNLNPEALRYYYAAKLSSKIDDIDLNLEDFVLRVNSDLVGKLVNLASRSAGFITKKFNGQLSSQLIEPELFESFAEKLPDMAQLYDQLDYSKLVREIMSLADLANQFVERHKPWELAKQEGQQDQLQKVCTTALNLFKILMGALKPILPDMALHTEKFLNISFNLFSDLKNPLLNHQIQPFTPLMTRLELERVLGMGNMIVYIDQSAMLPSFIADIKPYCRLHIPDDKKRPIELITVGTGNKQLADTDIRLVQFIYGFPSICMNSQEHALAIVKDKSARLVISNDPKLQQLAKNKSISVPVMDTKSALEYLKKIFT